MPKTKKGEEITWKEFMERWKSGIEGITPEQRIDAQVSGTKIMLLGLFFGICLSLYKYKSLWWVAIILTGSFIVTWMQYISYKQQLNIFKTITKELEGGKHGHK